MEPTVHTPVLIELVSMPGALRKSESNVPVCFPDGYQVTNLFCDPLFELTRLFISLVHVDAMKIRSYNRSSRRSKMLQKSQRRIQSFCSYYGKL